MPSKYELREERPEYAVLTCRGDLSWDDREHLAGAVDHFLASRPVARGVAVDLGEVEFVSSAGLGALIQVVQQVRRRGGTVVLANVAPAIERLLETAGIPRLASLARDLPEALRRIAEAPEPLRPAVAQAEG